MTEPEAGTQTLTARGERLRYEVVRAARERPGRGPDGSVVLVVHEDARDVFEEAFRPTRLHSIGAHPAKVTLHGETVWVHARGSGPGDVVSVVLGEDDVAEIILPPKHLTPEQGEVYTCLRKDGHEETTSLEGAHLLTQENGT